MACSACESGNPCEGGCAGGACTIPASSAKVGTSPTIHAHKVVTRYDWDPTNEANSLQPWGSFAGDLVGGVRYRGFQACDEIRSVSAALLDSDGNPLTSDAEILIFMLRRTVDRTLWKGADRNPVLWRNIINVGQREFRGGISYANPDDPRELTATNFGHGWEVGADWTSTPGRDNAMPPVLYVLYRVSLAAGFDQFTANMKFRSNSTAP